MRYGTERNAGFVTHVMLRAAAVIVLAAGMSVLATGIAGAQGPGKGGGGGTLGGGPVIGPQPTPFDGCGTVVQGVECLLFKADEGGLYVVPGLGFNVVVIGPDGEPIVVESPYKAGDRVHVEGFIDSTCLTFCQQGNGCIVQAEISECETKKHSTTIDDDDALKVVDLLHLLDAWGACESGSCRWDLNGDGTVNTQDIVVFASKM